MIRYGIVLLLIGCAHSIDDPMPPDQQPIKSSPNFKHHTEYQPEPILICNVKNIEAIEDCKLYSLTCDDNSDQLILLCFTQPLGVITNPPLPIR